MQVFRVYRCDFGHEWVIHKGESVPEDERDVVCPEGHEAVTCHAEYPADEVQVLIRPAARIVDPVRQQRVLDGRYWLVLLDRSGAEIESSLDHYSWDDVVSLARLFRGKPAEDARRWWARKKP
jgi:hypothetical protein